jgi:hypothetical protein
MADAVSASLDGDPTPALAITCPASLNPRVREYLEDLVAKINESPIAPMGVLLVRDGLFVALHAFEMNDIEPAMAIRSLQSAGMLVVDPEHPKKPIVDLRRRGVRSRGVVVAAGFFRGLEREEGLRL